MFFKGNPYFQGLNPNKHDEITILLLEKSKIITKSRFYENPKKKYFFFIFASFSPRDHPARSALFWAKQRLILIHYYTIMIIIWADSSLYAYLCILTEKISVSHVTSFIYLSLTNVNTFVPIRITYSLSDALVIKYTYVCT